MGDGGIKAIYYSLFLGILFKTYHLMEKHIFAYPASGYSQENKK